MGRILSRNLIADAEGNLYGTTYHGGEGCNSGCDTVFKLNLGSMENGRRASYTGLEAVVMAFSHMPV